MIASDALRLTAGLFAITLSIGNGLMADEPIELPPREAEILTVMPRVTTGQPTTDPVWIQRGAVRAEGTYETPSPETRYDLNRRQIDLLRTLDKLRLFQPEDDLDFRHPAFPSIADKIARPEVLTIPPRIAK